MSGLGVDIHPYYQRGTNALPGVEYGWIKMADGAAVYSKKVDGKIWTADAHAALFRRLGIPFGGYEFAELNTDGALAFDVLWGECLRLGATGVAPAVDIEGAGWNPTNATARGRAFCARARARGIRPAVYMDLTLLRDCRPDRWPERPVIWAPRYGAKPETLLHGVQYTGHYDVHQYESEGSLPGSAGLVDWNQAYTTEHMIGDSSMAIEQADVEKILNGSVKATDGKWYYVKDMLAAVAPLSAQIASQSAQIAGLTTLVKELANDPDITVDQMREIVNEAVEQHISITGELHIGPAPAPTSEEPA